LIVIAQTPPFKTIVRNRLTQNIDSRSPQDLPASIQHPYPFPSSKEKKSISLHSVSLKILTSKCIDTSGKFSLSEDSTTVYADAIARTQDGNTLVCGTYPWQYNPNYVESGYLFKCDDDGNVLWAKRYDSANLNSYINYYKILELHDGTILLGGTLEDRVTGNDNVLLTRTDANGNIIWSKIYKSRLWTRTGNSSYTYYLIKDMKEDPYNGDVYIAGDHYYEGRSLIRLNAVDGTIYWSNLYQPGFEAFFDHAFGVDIGSDEVRFWGHFGNNFDWIVSGYRIKKSTGDTLQTKYFKVAEAPYVNLSFLGDDPIVKLNNGNIGFSGYLFGDFLPVNGKYYHYGVAEFDTALNFVNGFYFYNNISFGPRVTLFPDGSGLMVASQYVSDYSSIVHFLQFKDGIIAKQRKQLYTGLGVPVSSYAVKTNNGADMFEQVISDSALHSTRIQFTKLHLTDTASDCLGTDELVTSVENYHLYQRIGPWILSVVMIFLKPPIKH
jgi:hypothetical protein